MADADEKRGDGTRRNPRKYATWSASKRAKQEREKQRALSRVNLGDQWGRWREIMKRLEVKSHAKFAAILLDW